jgi:hypothetical protein
MDGEKGETDRGNGERADQIGPWLERETKSRRGKGQESSAAAYPMFHGRWRRDLHGPDRGESGTGETAPRRIWEAGEGKGALV